MSIILADTKPASATLREPAGDCAIHLIEARDSWQPLFTLYGYAQRYVTSAYSLPLDLAHEPAGPEQVWSVMLSLAESTKLLALVKVLSVPALRISLPERNAGPTYELSILRKEGNLRFQWGGMPPPDWASVSAVADYVQQLADSTFAHVFPSTT